MPRPHPVSILLVLSIFAVGGSAAMAAEPSPTILTGNVFELRETVSPQGFVHPGISCNAETLTVMREKVIAGVSPWVDHFEGIRRTRFADPKRKPARVEQIVSDAGINGFAHDAHLAWAQTILYVVTGNEEYRKLPVEIIKWYGSRTEKSFFPAYFEDSHIKIGKYVYTLASAADILRATTPKDTRLAVTPAMINALQKNCFLPIRKNSIERNSYFMNQHTYAIMGYLASTILGDEVEDYKQAVEWTTVNSTTPNPGRDGSIKNQIRLVTRDDRTGEAVEPSLQLAEMGRDMPHAEGNLTNLLMMAKAIDFQKTKIDPVAGTVTTKTDGLSPIHFLDDRLPKGVALFAKFNLGFGLPWVPIYSETDPKHPDYLARYDHISPRGRGVVSAAHHYYYYKGIGLDMETGSNRYIKAAFDATAAGRERARSGGYFDGIHNYGFDFWIGLPAAASDAAPDPMKAKRALAKVLPPLEVTHEGRALDGRQFEYRFVDLSAIAQPGDIYPGSPNDIPLKVRRDPDGTGYVRMAIDRDPRTVVVTGRFPRGSGLRVRSDGFVKLGFYRNEDFSRPGGLRQELYIPNTSGGWIYVITDVESNGLTYLQATPLAGATTLDFDRIETDASVIRPLAFDSPDDAPVIPAYVGARIEKTIKVSGGSKSATLRALNLPAGATFGATTGKLSWTPTAEQTGDHVLYAVARDGDTMRTLRMDIHVARDLQAALDFVARPYDPAQRYIATTGQAFKAALASRDLAALQRAVNGLTLVSPCLPDGTLDYRVAVNSSERGVNNMADADPFSFGGIWGFDKNVTLDFGNDFKVKSEAFRMLARDGHPVRVSEAVVYGSNNRKHWTLLTENKSGSSSDWHTLSVKEEARNKPYRYIRLFMPPKRFPIFEIAEFRIVGERIEDYSPDQRVAYISGYADGTFRPNQKLTKAEAVSLLAGLVDDYTDKGAYDCAFVDVPRTAPYFDDVAYMSRKGVGNSFFQPVKYVVGDANNRFHPEAPITRGELAAIMARMQGLKEDASPALKKAAANAPVTRAEFVIAVNRMTGRTATKLPRESLPKFSDVNAAHPAYADIMKAITTY
ncbi:MAG: S-layer homology domain-containing protein [Rariglobus sp.]